MPIPPSTWDALREWLTLVAVGTSALFAGLIWWLARKRLTTRYIAEVNTANAGPDKIHVGISILNRGDHNLTIEALSVEPPWYIPTSESGQHFGTVNRSALEKAQRVHQVTYVHVIKPDEAHSFSVAVGRVGGLKDCKRASIALHILKSFPTVRHKKKVLTAILPARIRNSQL